LNWRKLAFAFLLVSLLLPSFLNFESVKAQEEYLKIYYDSERGCFYFLTLNNETVVIERNGMALLNRWDGEAWIDFGSFPSEGEMEIEVEAELEENKLKWKGKWKIGEEEVEIEIELEPKNISEYGDLEWSMKLTDKPPINVFSLPIQSENLKFYYQPPLYEEYGFSEPFSNSTFSVNATHVMRLINGSWVNEAYRPENVVGSYAVYHAYKMNNEYKTGKAFHIYRPKVTDSAGNEVWCNLKISDGFLKIEIPQDFLDNAIYPIVIDPTFGFETKGGSGTYYWTLGYLTGSKFLCPDNGQPESITVYMRQYASDTPKIKAAIYKDDNDYPQQLIAYTEEWTLTNGWYDWKTFNIVWIGENLTANTNYWLIRWASRDFWAYYDTAGRGIYKSKIYGNFPDPYPSGGTLNCYRWSIYCTYTAITPTGEWHSLAYDFNLDVMKWNPLSYSFSMNALQWHSITFPLDLITFAWYKLFYIYDLTVYGWHHLIFPFALDIMEWNKLPYDFVAQTRQWNMLSFPFTLVKWGEWYKLAYLFNLTVLQWHPLPYFFTLDAMQWNILNYTFQTVAMMWHTLPFPFTLLPWQMWHRLIYPFEVFIPGSVPVVPPGQPWYADTRLVLMFAFCLFFTGFLMKKLMLD